MFDKLKVLLNDINKVSKIEKKTGLLSFQIQLIKKLKDI